MDTYYDIKLSADIPHGSDILNKACSIVFTYPNGSFSDQPYKATILSWPEANKVRIKSRVMNIEAGWNGANGGKLKIETAAGLTLQVSAFAKV